MLRVFFAFAPHVSFSLNSCAYSSEDCLTQGLNDFDIALEDIRYGTLHTDWWLIIKKVSTETETCALQLIKTIYHSGTDI
jgi:hypothetical protein